MAADACDPILSGYLARISIQCQVVSESGPSKRPVTDIILRFSESVSTRFVYKQYIRFTFPSQSDCDNPVYLSPLHLVGH